MSARGIVLGAGGLLLLLACESWDPSIRARARGGSSRARAEREDPDLDPSADESAAEPEPEPAVSAAERVIRAGLDAHRADIVACTQHDPTVLRVTYSSDGELDVHLSGGLEGSPEEGCVRAALSGARAPEGESGTVLHLVHGG